MKLKAFAQSAEASPLETSARDVGRGTFISLLQAAIL